jgi:hypothetical protein
MNRRRTTTPLRAALGAIALAVAAAFAAPVPAAAATPTSMNLYNAAGFRYQDPNPYACTSTSAMDMLNFIAIAKTGGTGFRWKIDLSGAKRDSMLSWMRQHDTLKGGYGSDPHGWRNALNYYGYGEPALWEGNRVYEDLEYGSFDYAVKAAVRQMIRYSKPVGLLAWAGKHAQIVTGFYGVNGDPFAKNAEGKYTNAFTVAGFILADPLASQGLVNVKVSYLTLKNSTNLKVRFRTYLETDSPYDDPYTAGYRRGIDEFYGKFVIIAPVR